MTANDIIRLLGLEPLPHEGGFFRQTWLHPHRFPNGAFPRSAGSAIYGLLTERDFSALHRLKTDEIWHFYAGDPLHMLNLLPDGSVRQIRLGTSFGSGEIPQHVVPADVWQGTRPVARGPEAFGWSLVGCTMAPAFDWLDFELGKRDLLQINYPSAHEEISKLIRIDS